MWTLYSVNNPLSYRRVIGRLLYLTLTRPDISYAVQHLSQFLQQPTDSHYQAAMHVLRYLKGTPNKGLFYPKDNNFQITAYSDADWGTCEMCSRSLTGYFVFLGDSLVSWKTKKQKIVAKSSVKAEYRAMSVTTYEVEWIAHLLLDLHLPLKTFQFLCTVTIKLLSTLQKILFSVNRQHNSTLIATTLVTRCLRVFCKRLMFLHRSKYPVDSLWI